MCVRERGGGRRRTTANDGGRRPAGCKRENKNPTVMWGIKMDFFLAICDDVSQGYPEDKVIETQKRCSKLD